MCADANNKRFIVSEKRVEQKEETRGRGWKTAILWFLKKRDNNAFGKDRFSHSCYCWSRATFAGLVLCEKILLRKPQEGQRTLGIYVSWHVSSPCLPLSRVVFLSLVGFFFFAPLAIYFFGVLPTCDQVAGFVLPIGMFLVTAILKILGNLRSLVINTSLNSNRQPRKSYCPNNSKLLFQFIKIIRNFNFLIF